MGRTTLAIPSKYTTPIAYHPKTGKPVFLIAGGEDDPENPVVVADPPVTPPPVNPDDVFTKKDVEALLAKARKEEKDKVYGRVDRLQEQLQELQSERDAREAAEAKARKEAEAAQKAAAEAEMSAKELLDQREREAQERFAQLEQSFAEKFAAIETERQSERALLAKEREFNELQTYRAERLQALEDEIAPQFHRFIQGNNKEEIDAAIEQAVASSAEIAQQFQQAVNQNRQRQVGTSPSGLPPMGGPQDIQAGEKRFSAEELAQMDMATYAKNRHLFIGNGGGNNRGLLG